MTLDALVPSNNRFVCERSGNFPEYTNQAVYLLFKGVDDGLYTVIVPVFRIGEFGLEYLEQDIVNVDTSSLSHISWRAIR